MALRGHHLFRDGRRCAPQIPRKSSAGPQKLCGGPQKPAQPRHAAAAPMPPAAAPRHQRHRRAVAKSRTSGGARSGAAARRWRRNSARGSHRAPPLVAAQASPIATVEAATRRSAAMQPHLGMAVLGAALPLSGLAPSPGLHESFSLGDAARRDRGRQDFGIAHHRRRRAAWSAVDGQPQSHLTSSSPDAQTPLGAPACLGPGSGARGGGRRRLRRFALLAGGGRLALPDAAPRNDAADVRLDLRLGQTTGRGLVLRQRRRGGRVYAGADGAAGSVYAAAAAASPLRAARRTRWWTLALRSRGGPRAGLARRLARRAGAAARVAQALDGEGGLAVVGAAAGQRLAPRVRIARRPVRGERAADPAHLNAGTVGGASPTSSEANFCLPDALLGSTKSSASARSCANERVAWRMSRPRRMLELCEELGVVAAVPGVLPLLAGLRGGAGDFGANSHSLVCAARHASAQLTQRAPKQTLAGSSMESRGRGSAAQEALLHTRSSYRSHHRVQTETCERVNAGCSQRLRRGWPRAAAARSSRCALAPLLHVPLLMGAKVLVGATLKRLALSNLVKKVGVKRTVNDIRALNRKLHEAAPATYPASTMALADASLDVLERSLRGLREDEQVQAAWRWFASLESDNPTFAAAILKTLLETLRPVKWAATLLSPDKSDAPPAEEPAAAAASREMEELLQRAKAAVPELEDYHVLLVPKSAFDEEEVELRSDNTVKLASLRRVAQRTSLRRVADVAPPDSRSAQSHSGASLQAERSHARCQLARPAPRRYHPARPPTQPSRSPKPR